jgi:hypothetical protein
MFDTRCGALLEMMRYMKLPALKTNVDLVNQRSGQSLGGVVAYKMETGVNLKQLVTCY